jgi:hypothetical protein
MDLKFEDSIDICITFLGTVVRPHGFEDDLGVSGVVKGAETSA